MRQSENFKRPAWNDGSSPSSFYWIIFMFFCIKINLSIDLLWLFVIYSASSNRYCSARPWVIWLSWGWLCCNLLVLCTIVLSSRSVIYLIAYLLLRLWVNSHCILTKHLLSSHFFSKHRFEFSKSIETDTKGNCIINYKHAV